MSASRRIAKVQMVNGSIYEVSDQTEGIAVGDRICEKVNSLIQAGETLIARRSNRTTYHALILRSASVEVISEAQE